MNKCVDCKYFDLLYKKVFKKTTYCKYGNKVVNTFTNKTLACKNFEKKR